MSKAATVQRRSLKGAWLLAATANELPRVYLFCLFYCESGAQCTVEVRGEAAAEEAATCNCNSVRASPIPAELS